MKINFKKIATVIGSAVLLGSTVGIAAAASYPAPFISGGSANVAVVIGANAALSDAVAATNLGSDLASELASQTATGGSAGSASASGGDSINLATSSQKLYWNSTMDSAKTTLTSSELPTILGDGKVTDDTGTAYSYTQSITLGNRTVAYGTSGADFDDPTLYLDAGYTADAWLYSYKLTFNKALNITDATNVQGNDITVFGKTYTIGSGSDSGAATPLLYLYETGESVTLNEGEETKVTVSGVEYTIKVTAITQASSTDYVSVSIDGGSSREIAELSSSKVGSLEVFAKTVTYSAKESTQNSATLSIGSGKLKFSNGNTVYQGSDETTIQNTAAYLTTSSGSLSGLQVHIAMQNTVKDYILSGGAYTDPVFGGLKVSFASTTPSLDSTSRDKFVIDTDNSRNAKITFTDALSGSEYSFTFAHDVDTSESTTNIRLNDTAGKEIHVYEGEGVALNEYMMINSGDYGRIIKLTNAAETSLTSTSTIQFQDALTGENLFSGSGLGLMSYSADENQGNTTTNINGQPYYFHVVNGTTSYVNVTWGAGASYGITGDVTTVSPRIKLKNGGWFAIITNSTYINGTTYSLPGVETLSTYEAGTELKNNTIMEGSAQLQGSMKFGNVNYSFKSVDAGAETDAPTFFIEGIDVNGDMTLDCNITMQSTAILYIEEKKTSETSNADNGDVICVAIDENGATTPVEISIGQPYVSGAFSGLTSWTSDSYQQSGVTRYGTYIKYNSLDNDKVEIYYPDEQMFADILFTAEAATINAGSSSGSSVTELGAVTVYDSEITSVSSKNLIVVGGSCINTVAAKLLGSTSAICGADFTTSTGIADGQYLIQAFDSPYQTGKTAMLVAGYNAADTTKAVTYLTNNAVTTTVGTKLKGTSATEATVVTSSTTV